MNQELISARFGCLSALYRAIRLAADPMPTGEDDRVIAAETVQRLAQTAQIIEALQERAANPIMRAYVQFGEPDEDEIGANGPDVDVDAETDAPPVELPPNARPWGLG
jgi:hypothetical protein